MRRGQRKIPLERPERSRRERWFNVSEFSTVRISMDHYLTESHRLLLDPFWGVVVEDIKLRRNFAEN